MDEGFIFVLLLCFVVVVIPTWLKMHYGNRKQSSAPLPESERGKLDSLQELADTLNERVQNLEAILDAETPEWRKKYD